MYVCFSGIQDVEGEDFHVYRGSTGAVEEGGCLSVRRFSETDLECLKRAVRPFFGLKPVVYAPSSSPYPSAVVPLFHPHAAFSFMMYQGCFCPRRETHAYAHRPPLRDLGSLGGGSDGALSIPMGFGPPRSS